MSDRVASELAKRLETLAEYVEGDAEALEGESGLLEAEAWMYGADALARAVRALRELARSGKHLDGDTAARVRELLQELAGALSASGELDEASLDACRELTQLVQRAEEMAAPPAAQGTFHWEPPEDQAMTEAFLQECRERLEALSDELLELEAADSPGPLVDEIFRNLHTLKGSSAFVRLEPLNKLAHAAEDLVSGLRASGSRPSPAVTDTLLAARDAMARIVEDAFSGRTVDWQLVEATLARLANPTESAPDTSRADLSPLPRREATIRVDFSKLDRLLNSVGELVVVRSGLQRAHRDLEALTAELEDLVERQERHEARQPSFAVQLERLHRVAVDVHRDVEQRLGRFQFATAKLRDEVMELRMVPVSRIFSKMRRTVRDLAKRLGKVVRLELEGEDTAVDKHVVERLDEPLVHLVRNALDHGLESPEERQAAGKPRQGTIRLAARHEGSLLVVEVSDDGRGIDPEAVRRKAVERGVLTAEEAGRAEDRLLYELLFRPGFSTARELTELSGRGVGLDVVAQVLGELRGTVTVVSEKGQGTTFTITLPLTLAIRQVLLARVANRTVALPLEFVIRTLPLDPSRIRHTAAGRVWQEGSALLAMVDLAGVLGLPSTQAAADYLVFVRHGGEQYVLSCQDLLGRQEILVKQVEGISPSYPFLAGATLLDDQVVPILDVPAVIRNHIQNRGSPGPVPRGQTRQEDRRALVVDDSLPARKALGDQLETMGFEVLEAEDGLQALQILEDHTVDLVCTDMMMPNMDGYELTRALRASKRYESVPIVMVSVRGERVDMVRGFDAGVDAYLTKPVDHASLARTLARLLRQPTQEDTHAEG